MACVAERSTRKAMEDLQATNLSRYNKIVGPFDRMRRDGLTVLLYTTAMGSPVALMIWPWIAVHSATGFTLHRQTAVFIESVAAFVRGSGEFPYIQSLINHISAWFDGWVLGRIRAVEAIDQLSEFLCDYTKGRTPDETIGARLIRDYGPEHHGTICDIIRIFTNIPRPVQASYSAIGTGEHQISLTISDMETLGSQEQLSERAIEAALLTTEFPKGVMVARASGYGSFYDQREYLDGIAMEIDPDADMILCPIHTGASEHWVGVVVYFGHYEDGEKTISMQLLDSLTGKEVYERDASKEAYDGDVALEIVLTWLWNKIPDHDNYEEPKKLPRKNVTQQSDLNSCGVHMISNLLSVGFRDELETGASRAWVDYTRRRIAL